MKQYLVNPLKMVLHLIACTTMAWFYSAAVYGHEDLDLAIKDIKFDPECRPIVVIQNTGERPLPATFYLAVNPAFLTVSKEAPNNLTKAQSQISKSLRALDSQKKLLPVGGELAVRFDKPMISNPAPLTAKLSVQGEFWEYDQKNDQLSMPIDCVPGKGTIAGAKKKPIHADLALAPITIVPNTCQVSVQIINSNQAPLPENAWDGSEGVVVSVYDVEKESRLAPVSLLQLDTERKLSQEAFNFQETRNPGLYRYSLWQVKDDPEFSNNHQEVDLRGCKAPGMATP